MKKNTAAVAAALTASASSTAAGSYSIITFSVPHGCEGSPTTVVTIDIPEDILSVTPTRNPFWAFERTTVPLDPPTEDHSERTSQVVYTAVTPLPEGVRDNLELSVRLPAGEAGDVVEFPVLQTCEVGLAEWIGDEVPSITLTASEGDPHGGGTSHAETEPDAAAQAEAPAAAAPASGDILARVLAVVGLIVGAVGLAFGVMARRKAAQSS